MSMKKRQKKEQKNKRMSTSLVKKTPTNRHVKYEGEIIALAFFHRYGWIAVMLLFAGVFKDYFIYIVSSCFIIFSVWTFIGYKCKWKHIFCSYQNAYHRKMTPGSIDWDWIDKKDAYGIPLIFLVLALMGIVAGLFL